VRELPPLSLAAWAGQKVKLILSTAPGNDTSFDWAYFQNPRVASGNCGLTDSLVTLHQRGESELRHGAAEAVGRSLVLRPARDTQTAELAFRIQPEENSCLAGTLYARRGDAQLELRVEAGRSRSVLFDERVPAGRERTPKEHRLGAWTGKRVSLVLAMRATNSATQAGYDGPVVRRCVEDGR
jgi:hypothetical protein